MLRLLSVPGLTKRFFLSDVSSPLRGSLLFFIKSPIKLLLEGILWAGKTLLIIEDWKTLFIPDACFGTNPMQVFAIELLPKTLRSEILFEERKALMILINLTSLTILRTFPTLGPSVVNIVPPLIS